MLNVVHRRRDRKRHVFPEQVIPSRRYGVMDRFSDLRDLRR